MLPKEAQENSNMENSDYPFALLWPPKDDTKIHEMEHTGKDENVFLTGIRATYTPVDCGGGQGPLLLRGTGTTVQSHSIVREQAISILSGTPRATADRSPSCSLCS